MRDAFLRCAMRTFHTSETNEELTAAAAQQALAALTNPEKAEVSRSFFKTGAGEYGEGDRFRGVKVPDQRRLARRLWRMPLSELERLLRSEWHEDRLLALLCLVRRYEKVPDERPKIHELYLSNTACVNGWDLVDSSAEYLVGAHLTTSDLSLLDRLARSQSLWERRIAMLATFHFTKRGVYAPALRIAGALLNDREDLLHKAVGWMLREVGARDREAEERFLAVHYRKMPRTMLRYAIEKFPESRRLAYLHGLV